MFSWPEAELVRRLLLQADGLLPATVWGAVCLLCRALNHVEVTEPGMLWDQELVVVVALRLSIKKYEMRRKRYEAMRRLRPYPKLTLLRAELGAPARVFSNTDWTSAEVLRVVHFCLQVPDVPDLVALYSTFFTRWSQLITDGSAVVCPDGCCRCSNCFCWVTTCAGSRRTCRLPVSATVLG
eukprot:TRINITY_DN14058_c0_g1_i3.p1 TRINITY_DN14058_c0_g1~~TRINITY_DN14058_c0_g1_i3.p1  ORF type:complete len:182 (+),score=28.01 TRINITY_DN14058_c0_g1_i3:103-648(+)